MTQTRYVYDDGRGFRTVAELNKETRLDDDPLAYSCARNRMLRDGAEYFYLDVHTMNVTRTSITSVDRELAANIRKYYYEKLMVQVLLDKELPKFRRNLHKMLLNSEKNIVIPNDLPMISSLPKLYAHDLELDTIFPSVSYSVDTTLISTKLDTGNYELSFVKALPDVRRRKKGFTQYWFKDDAENIFVCEMSKNPATPIVSQLLTESSKVKIKAKFKCVEFYERKFFSAAHEGWSLVSL